jgi:DnaJ-like protein
MAQAFPLQWPLGWPRTKKPLRSRFGQRRGEYNMLQKITMTRARDFLIGELVRLKATNGVISTNLALRNDGLPRANQKTPEDTGVAVYFTLKGQQKCFPCDKWDRVEDNLYAIAKTIDALRGIDRWGSQSMVDATFNGFKALPDPGESSWREVLGIQGKITAKELSSIFRKQAQIHHPDKGGDPDEFDRIKKAYNQGLKELEGSK